MLNLVRQSLAAAAMAVAALGGAAAFDPAFAAKPAVYTKADKIAVGGYDPVSYFSGAPVKGAAQFQTTHEGATFQFANAENLAKFKADPAKYAPQFGGYCAYAVAKGGTAPGNPLNYTVHEGKLYLNLNSGIQKKWEANKSGYIADANSNWPKVIK